MLRRIRRLFRSQKESTAAFGDVRVAAVVDEFTGACLAPEVDLLSLDARRWKLELAVWQPHILFVESAWRGKNDSWRYRVASYDGKSDDTLSELVSWCRARKIPTVFWNKEDPVHFDRFRERARLFDFVFTTDEGKVDDYRRLEGRAREVHPLAFAAQPALHYPSDAPREDVVCFAGSYGEAQFPERRRDLEVLLDGSLEFDLRILDRNAKTAREGFPERYRKFVREGVDYAALNELHRRYKVFLNVNSIRDSRTMFSRRVFELLACGTSVVSSPSVGVSEMFGDVVAVVDSAQEARAAVSRFLSDEEHRRETAARGIRRVHLAHTYEHRMRVVLERAGVATREDPRRFALFAIVHSGEEAERLAALLQKQELRPNEHVFAVGDHSVRERIGKLGVKVEIVEADGDEMALARRSASRTSAPWIACVSLDRDHGPELFSSLVCCTRFSGADLIGRQPGVSYARAASLDPRAILIRREALETHGWSSEAEDRERVSTAYRELVQYAAF